MTVPTCHPERKHRTGGLCNACYCAKFGRENREKIKAQQRAYREANKAKIYLQRKAYRERNKDNIAYKQRIFYSRTKPLRREQQRDYMLRMRHGISLDDYTLLLESQKGACAICERSKNLPGNGKRLHVDHDHKTGIIRGLLCHDCNLVLGNAHDSMEILKAALKYLTNLP